MTAPAKAAPMREDVTPLIEMLRAATVEEGCVVFEHSPEEIGWAVMEAHNEVLARLAHTARPDAGDEDVERVAQSEIEDAMDNAGSFDPGEVVVPISVAYKLAAMREGVDRGMVEVPREPTLAMEQAVWTMSTDDYSHGQIYTAMIAAALSPEQPR